MDFSKEDVHFVLGLMALKVDRDAATDAVMWPMYHVHLCRPARAEAAVCML